MIPAARGRHADLRSDTDDNDAILHLHVYMYI